MKQIACVWCGAEFEPRATGGRRQRFCSTSCRQDFYGACRDWTVGEVEAGRVLVSTVRDARQQRARSLESGLGPNGTQDAPEAGTGVGRSPAAQVKAA